MSKKKGYMLMNYKICALFVLGYIIGVVLPFGVGLVVLGFVCLAMCEENKY
ncbi:MAG: hypothetical protein LBC86_03040 [Oscillospiraceae bacterium]|nr:hypothetical protein [Oscillospiraceae bacterium]